MTTKTKMTEQIDKIIYETILFNRPITRNELVKKTKIPRTTIFDSTVRLILQNKIYKFSEKRNKPGRPKIYYSV